MLGGEDGWLIGSGAVESACKTVVGQLPQAGRDTITGN